MPKAPQSNGSLISFLYATGGIFNHFTLSFDHYAGLIAPMVGVRLR